MLLSVSTALFFLMAPASGGSACSDHNNCNGHGTCNTKTCACVDGWGSATDVSLYKNPACKERTFPEDLLAVSLNRPRFPAFPRSRASLLDRVRPHARVPTTPRTPPAADYPAPLPSYPTRA